MGILEPNQEVNYLAMLNAAPILLNLDQAQPLQVVAAMLDEMVSEGRLPAELREAAAAAIHERETTGGSTALANGIAVPHGYLAELTEPVVAFGVHRAGIDCGAIDGLPSRIFVMILGPRGVRAHLRFLAAVNRRLMNEAIREGILVAKTREEVVRLLAS